MKVLFRFIQFRVNWIFAAPVNVGVIVWGNGSVHLRLLGCEEPEQFRWSVYRRLAGDQEISEDILKEWVGWFRSLVARPHWFVEHGQAKLDRLTGTESPFSGGELGEVDFEGEELVLLVDDLHLRALHQNESVRRLVFEDRVDSVIQRAGIATLSDATKDAEIELVPKKGLGSGLVHFPWFVDTVVRRVGIKTVNFDDDPVAVSQQVADAMSSFEVAIARKILDREGCVVLISGDTTAYPQQASWLNVRALVLNVKDADAAERLRAAVLG